MAQQVKDLALSLLWHQFDPWPWNFCRLWAWPQKRRRHEGWGPHFRLFQSVKSPEVRFLGTVQDSQTGCCCALSRAGACA